MKSYFIYSLFIIVIWVKRISPGRQINNLQEFITHVQESLYDVRIKSARARDGIIFKCQTKGDPSPFILTINDMSAWHKLDCCHNLGFVVHGWKGDGSKGWTRKIQKNWIRYHRRNHHQNTIINVCIVDWSSMARSSVYKDALLNIFDVGLTLARMVEMLESRGFSRRKMTFVGFSLGAHVAGYAGYILKGRVNEIIGLDPAGPMFTMPFNVNTKYRLDASDAEFVQVLHTSGGTLGTHLKCGHADFYPNGGASPQSYCLFKSSSSSSSSSALASTKSNSIISTSSEESMQTIPLISVDYQDLQLQSSSLEARGSISSVIPEPVSCSHSIAVNYFLSSMNPKQSEFQGQKCSNYQFYLFGVCNQNAKARFGIHSRRIHGDFYFSIKLSAAFADEG